MAYHKAVAIINNVGGPRAAVSARAHARYETNGRPRYGGRVWRGGRLLSSGQTRAVFRGVAAARTAYARYALTKDAARTDG